MQPTDDGTLLRQYTEDHSDEAFAALVTRHVNLVYSVALRHVGDPHLAEEISQSVFITFAKKAAQLRHDKALSSWLFQTTRLTASNLVRGETHRHRREQEAHMQSVLNESGSDLWPRIAPLLDDAVAALGDVDRDAIVLRFYEGRNLRDVGVALGASEDAAEKRVNRAVEKLRAFFAKRGVTVGTSGLVVVISANAVQAAPVGLAVAISTAVALVGTTVATTATAINTIAMTTLQKTLVTATVAVLAGTGIYEARQASQLRGQVQTLQQQQAPLTEQIQRLQREREESERQLAALRVDNDRLNRNTGELLKLRGEVGVLRQQVANHNSPTPQPVAQTAAATQPADLVEQTKRMGRAKGLDGRNYATQFVMFAADNQGWFPTNWQQVANYSKDFPVSGTNDFEMIHRQPIHRNDLGTNANRTALVREYLAWPTSDGRWGKIYGFADGHSQVVILKNGDFTDWERENTFNPQSDSN